MFTCWQNSFGVCEQLRLPQRCGDILLRRLGLSPPEIRSCRHFQVVQGREVIKSSTTAPCPEWSGRRKGKYCDTRVCCAELVGGGWKRDDGWRGTRSGVQMLRSSFGREQTQPFVQLRSIKMRLIICILGLLLHCIVLHKWTT